MKTLKAFKVLITSVDPVTAAILSLFTFGIFAVVYVLLGGEHRPGSEGSS